VWVRADPGRLEQVFLNLLSNAIEHAPGSGTIEVAVRSVGDRAVATVRDHGPGVAAADVRMMFEAYTRLGHPHRAPGLGLGLYVAREIANAHDGEIEATSRVGKGTTMTVRLPLARRRRTDRTKTRTRTNRNGTTSSS
jgi:signal transduction histidine kinase